MKLNNDICVPLKSRKSSFVQKLKGEKLKFKQKKNSNFASFINNDIQNFNKQYSEKEEFQKNSRIAF